MNYREMFEGKRVTLMGLGLLGRGVGDAAFLSECGAHLLVTDKKSEAELAESVQKLKQYPDITFKLGGHDIHDFEHCDLVIKAAGVPLDSPEIAAARAAGIPVVMSTALFAQYAMQEGTQIVGITGTRGKTTVTRLIHHALVGAGRSAYLGGNTRGVSTLALLPQITKDDIAILELDSWQLQGFGDVKISPQIAVFTNFYPDHMDYYKGDMEGYFADKANIFRYQKAGDALFVGRSVLEKVEKAQPNVAPHVPAPLLEDWRLHIVGEHNRENASFAVSALTILGLSQEEIKIGLETFEPVEGRLQLAREMHGINIYNDNNATTPEATVAAIRALKGRGPLTLMVGGTDKNVDLAELGREIDSSVNALVLFSGTGTEKLKALLSKRFQETDSLDEALTLALKATPSGGSILFSPAFASFGAFVNYYDRNDQFLELVKQMGDAA